MRLIDAKEMALSKSKGQLFPKVIDVLESLHKDYEALAICSNGEPGHPGTIIDSQGIQHFFDVVRCKANELDKNQRWWPRLLETSA
jgi:phosphoglycolate phosphatase-like HAD superfamily hydrolase